MSEGDIANDASATTLLQKSCLSITEKALSCRTLRLNPSTYSNDTLSLIQKELELAEWLDRNIFDCRATLARQQACTDGDDETTTPTRQGLRQKQQELLDETVRRQQERLLVSRIEMSSIAQDFMFPQPNTRRSERDKAEAVLVQEAIQSRDEQVTLALNKIQRLNVIRSQLHEATNESQTLLNENQRLWQQSAVATTDRNGATATTTTRQAIETRILKCALQDIIVSSDLDWYKDKRLRETMEKLET